MPLHSPAPRVTRVPSPRAATRAGSHQRPGGRPSRRSARPCGGKPAPPRLGDPGLCRPRHSRRTPKGWQNRCVPARSAPGFRSPSPPRPEPTHTTQARSPRASGDGNGRRPQRRFQTLPQPCPPLRLVSTCRGRKKTTRDAPRRRPGTPAGSAPSKLTRRVRTARPFLSFLSLPCAPPTKSGETGKRPDEASGHLGLCVLESCLAAALETQRRLRPRDSGRSGLDERRLNPHSRVPPPVPQASTHPARRAHSSPKPRSAGDSSSFLTPSQRSSSASRSPAPRFFRGALAAPGPPGPRAHGGALAAEDRLGIPSDGLAAVGGLARGATRKLSAQVCCALEEKAFPYKAQRRNAQAEP